MLLQEKIHQLRNQAGMSQGDLAEKLEVSRQSVSKWETGGAVPDLDKLVKMSELFGISLDELVKGELPPRQEPRAEPQVVYVERTEPAMPRRKIVGCVLFGFAALVIILLTVLGGLPAGLIMSTPFWLCGIICFVSEKRPGLWCAWAVYLLLDLYLRVATGISWGSLLGLLRNIIRNDIATVIAAVLSVLIGCLIWATVRSFKDRSIAPSKAVWTGIGVKLTGLVVCLIPWSGLLTLKLIEISEGEPYIRFAFLIHIVNTICQWGQVILLTWLLIDLFAIRRWKKASQENE